MNTRLDLPGSTYGEPCARQRVMPPTFDIKTSCDGEKTSRVQEGFTLADYDKSNRYAEGETLATGTN